MRSKLFALSLVITLFIPVTVFAEEENSNIIHFDLATLEASYEADAYSVITVESEEIYAAEDTLLADGMFFDISILSVDDVYRSQSTSFFDYFQALENEGADIFQAIVSEGKLNFSFRAGVISGAYELAATHVSTDKQYYGEFTVILDEFKPLVIEDVDIVPERPDLSDQISASLEAYTATPSYELEFSPVQLVEHDGKQVFRLNIWAKRVIDPSEVVVEQIQRYDTEIELPSVQEIGEYTLRIYQNGTVAYEHVFNIEPSSTTWLFRDVSNHHWAYNYIKALSDAGMVNGYADGTFRPESPITRAEFVKVVLNSAGIEILSSLNSDFNDVDSEAWYNDYITTARGLGIISGYRDGTFRPDEPILRQEATKAILRAFDIATIRVIEPSFDDVTEEWLDYIETGVSYDLWHGRSERVFEPRDYITRAEVNKIVDRIWDLE